MTKLIKGGEYEYEQKNRLGKGSFGEVFKGVVAKTNQVVAIKIISMKTLDKYGQQIKKVIASEVSVMSNLSNKMKESPCPYIVRIYDCFRTASSIFMILQFCGAGDLEGLIMEKKKIERKEGLQIIYQVCKALQFLGQNGVTHRDIKPQNIFIKTETDEHNRTKAFYKLGDFGFAAQKNTFSTTLGTYPYMAPQLFEYNQYDSSVDVWALGVMAHQILTGQIYFIGKDQWEIKKKVLGLNYQVSEKNKQYVWQEMEDFLSKCLIKNKEKRMKWSQLCQHKVFDQLRISQPTQVMPEQPNQMIQKRSSLIILIKQYVFKCAFLDVVATSMTITKRSCYFAIMYLLKRAYFNIGFLYSSILKRIDPFEVEVAVWDDYVKQPQFKQVQIFVEYYYKLIQDHFNYFYNYFQGYCKKFSQSNIEAIKQVINPRKQEDINNQIYTKELTKWRDALQNEEQALRKLSLEILLCININENDGYNFEYHVNNREALTEHEIKEMIFNI